RRLRDGHASHAEAVAHTGGESPQERCRGSARAEPHGGVVLDEPEGPASERTERFRWVEVHAFRPHNAIGLPPAAYPHRLLPLAIPYPPTPLGPPSPSFPHLLLRMNARIPPVLSRIARFGRLLAAPLSLRGWSPALWARCLSACWLCAMAGASPLRPSSPTFW